jgi:general secretion pathway protein H
VLYDAAKQAKKRRSRGVTLVEVLIAVALVAVVSGMAMMGGSVADGARLKHSAVMVASAVRIAYGHANATSKVVRLVFDIDQRTVSIEEASGDLKVARNDVTGGAAAATEAEKKATEESDAILKGPRTTRPTFQKVKTVGWDPDKDKAGRELEKNIQILQVETNHQDLPQKTGRAYLYFWPGGQTERAAIQIAIKNSEIDADSMTMLVSPLTGKTELRKGRLLMPRPRDDVDASERQDTGF